jgi:uncharacterized protein YbjT (DUF2867 family)
LDPDPGLIFITGGPGVIGHRVAVRLLNAGYTKIRLGVHDVSTVEDLNKLGAEVADFNWDLESTYDSALKGVKSVLCAPPYEKRWEDKFPAFVAACDRAYVKHFVKLSFYHARTNKDIFKDVPLVQAHAKCDRFLAGFGIGYTILGATHLMSNPLVYQGRELRKDQTPAVFYGSTQGKKVNYVSPNDIADVAMHALLAPKSHFKKEYTLTGPEAIADNDVAILLGKFLDKSIMYVDQPLHTFEDGEKMSGDPKWMVRDFVALEKIKATGAEEDLVISDDIQKICDHPAETFEKYLERKDDMTPLELP